MRNHERVHVYVLRMHLYVHMHVYIACVHAIIFVLHRSYFLFYIQTPGTCKTVWAGRHCMLRARRAIFMWQSTWYNPHRSLFFFTLMSYIYASHTQHHFFFFFTMHSTFAFFLFLEDSPSYVLHTHKNARTPCAYCTVCTHCSHCMDAYYYCTTHTHTHTLHGHTLHTHTAHAHTRMTRAHTLHTHIAYTNNACIVHLFQRGALILRYILPRLVRLPALPCLLESVSTVL